MEHTIKFKYPQFLYPALFNDFKYSCIKAGRRTGKTFNAAQWLIEELLSNPSSSGLWIDTTQNNLQKYVDRYFKVILQNGWDICHYDKQQLLLQLPNQSYIDFRSAERPHLMEGFEYDRVILNEAGIILRQPNLWYNSLQPMLKNATVKVIGTPKGKNFFHTLFHTNHVDFGQYSYSCYDSPFWTTYQLNELKKSIPQEVWEQEYLAEFLDNSSTVFRNIHQCIIDIDTSLHPKDQNQYVMGIDLAKQQDYTVIQIACLQEQTIIYFDKFHKIDWTLQKQRILNLWKKFNHPHALIDITGIGSPIVDDLQAQGMYNAQGYTFTNASKQKLIQQLSIGIDNQQIRFYDIPDLVNELKVFEYKMTKSGNFQYSAPQGVHDDCVISLALTYHLIKESQNNTPQLRII